MKPRKRCRCRDADGRDLGIQCPKLRRRDGSWNPNHGTWYAKKELPSAPDGKRVELKSGGFATEDELREWFDHAMLLLTIPEKGPRGHEARLEILRLIKEARANKADLPDYDDLRLRHKQGVALQTGLVRDYLDAWLEGKKSIRKNTYRGYESHIRVHLKPHLGHLELDRLRPEDISKMFAEIEKRNEKIRQGKARGRITGLATQKLILATLSNALGDGYPHIVWNPAKHVELAPAKKQKPLLWTAAREKTWRATYEERIAKERAARPGRNVDCFKIWRDPGMRPSRVMVWTPEMTGRFLDRAEGHRLYPLYVLYAHVGLRRGEGAGAEVDSLNLDAGELLISANLVQLGWETDDSDPKTEASDAPVALDQETVKVLRARMKQRNEERIAWGDAWVESGKIFCKENGEPYHPAYITDQFERIAFEADLPPVTLHGLRHGTATRGLAAGVDRKVISSGLRHSTTRITEDLYTSVVDDIAREAAEKTAAMIPRASRTKRARATGRAPNGTPSLKAAQRNEAI